MMKPVRNRNFYMRKLVNPSVCDGGNKRLVRAFATIEIKNGGLSICGVVGPMSNGDCTGGAGQCVDEINNGLPAEDWDQDMLDKFCSIWREWHLNKMTPSCQHQAALGWDKLATKEVSLYHFCRTNKESSLVRKAETEAVNALKRGDTFTPTKDQVFFANLPYEITSPEKELKEDLADYFEPRKPIYRGVDGFEEKKILGHTLPSEHPDGLLTKPCPVCGYKYGTAWMKRELPEDVIRFLNSLPSSHVRPAWEP